MHKIFYYGFRSFLWLTLRGYFSQIRIVGVDNIPQKEPVIFLANHQNAFLDAVLVVCHNKRYTHFLARADVFKSRVARWLLALLNISPIYRQRDGLSNVTKNDQVIDSTSELLMHNGTLIMFPEGDQGEKRVVRPISKGFTRIAFQVLKIDPNSNLKIIPVGLNYQDLQKFRTKVSVIFGRPQSANDFFKDEGSHTDSLSFRESVKSELETLTCHIDDPDHYDEILNMLLDEGIDLTDPGKANARIQEIIQNKEWEGYQHVPKEKPILSRVFYSILNINNLLVNLAWHFVKRAISDPLFTGSIKYAFMVFVLPLIYLLQVFAISLLQNPSLTWGYAVFCLLFPFYLKFYDDFVKT